MGFSSGTSTRWLFVHCFQIELEFGVLVFVEGGKPENPEKNPRSKDENQQQTQPTCDARSGNRTRATAVGGECSHHCTIRAPQNAGGYLRWTSIPSRRSCNTPSCFMLQKPDEAPAVMGHWLIRLNLKNPQHHRYSNKSSGLVLFVIVYLLVSFLQSSLIFAHLKRNLR